MGMPIMSGRCATICMPWATKGTWGSVKRRRVIGPSCSGYLLAKARRSRSRGLAECATLRAE